jgi:hypothetical protein
VNCLQTQKPAHSPIRLSGANEGVAGLHLVVVWDEGIEDFDLRVVINV